MSVAGRSDVLPRLTGGLLAGALACGLGARAARRRRVERGAGDEEFLETGAGNRIAYTLHRAARPRFPQDPVLVFVPGLGTPVARWSVLREALNPGFSVLTHDRAGYGRSRYRPGAPFTLDAARADLVDVIAAVPPGRPVILVGHGLGGLLAMAAQETSRRPVAGLVLLDPRYPSELGRSALLHSGSEQVGHNMSHIPLSCELGLAPLLAAPPWERLLTGEARRLCLDQYRDAGLWRAALREWRAAHTELTSGAPPKVTAPVHLVTSGPRSAQSRAYEEFGKELLASVEHGGHTVLERVRRDLVPLTPECVTALARVIGEFAGTVVEESGGRYAAPHHAG
ncbi:alpha/beta hydrolase [Streptomyces xiamenensis]|uniref:alpha/beta hydrolase n=1 Tax=Streptomyces xiamenensis TaxID=408015 RepID=UPI0036BA2495